MTHCYFLMLQGKLWFHFVNYKLNPSTHSTTVTLDRMCPIHSIVKDRKIDVGIILHEKITECTARQTGILVFISLVMLLCQQRGIMPSAGEEVLNNKGQINEAFVERMTRSKDTPILKKEKICKTKKGIAKSDSKGTNLNVETLLWHKLKDVKKMVNSINNNQIRLVTTVEGIEKSQNLFYAYTRAQNSSIVATFGQLSPSLLPEFLVLRPIIRNYDLSSSDDDLEDRDRSMASPPIVQVSDNEKEGESRDIDKCLRKIDCLFEGGIFADQKDTIVEKEVVATKEDIVAEEEEVVENEKEK
ncbi:hypothetical protein PVK06_002453 [Gossypium arboreum]|uniref:Uncharacterized protein n=1 Tax=Gossypium arboreum TaxID=29729 RepID=A0ABR0R3S8_GOSAR|nr:hypothetical protein PVK06_002453 [Gossypium arboreum]